MLFISDILRVRRLVRFSKHLTVGKMTAAAQKQYALAPELKEVSKAWITEPRTCGNTGLTTSERSNHMGDKKGKKDKAKGQRQKEAKQVKSAKQKKDRQQPRTP